MALLWMDGFDHYGSGASGRLAMLDGVWAEISSAFLPDVSNPRTGTYSLRALSTGINTNRRVLGGAKTVVGLGAAFFLSALPGSNDSLRVFDFRDASNVVQVSLYIQSTGTIVAYRGTTATLLGTTASPAIVAGAFQHVEARILFSQTVGTIEVRVNGVTVLNLTGLDTVASALVECSQVSVGGSLSNIGNITQDIDDAFAWDDTGVSVNDFQGDRRVRTTFPDADTAVADWTAEGAASGYDCINDAAPDEDATYIAAAPLVGSPATPLLSEFGLQNLSNVGSIAAVQTYIRMRKTEAGDANVTASMLSGSSASDGGDRAITEAYTYWMDVHELNPGTGNPWSETTFNAAKLRIARTA